MDNRLESPEAIELYRASAYCAKVERSYEILIIVMALLFSISSIFVKFIPQIADILGFVTKYGEPDAEGVKHFTAAYNNLVDASVSAGGIISFISGMWLIVQIVLKSRARVKHKEAVNIEERYDNYVLGLEPNKNIMRPITGSMIRHYASRHNGSGAYKKTIEKNQNAQLTIFYYQKRHFENLHGLMIYARVRFFNFAWWAYFLMIIGFSLFTNSTVIDALTLIFFPSLSAISLIVDSMIHFNEQFRYTSNALDCIKATEDEMKRENRSSVPVSTLRSIQDSLFLSRLNEMTIPSFIERSYGRYMRRRQRRLATHGPIPETPASTTKKAEPKKAEVKKADAKKSEQTKPVTKKAAGKKAGPQAGTDKTAVGGKTK